MQKHFSAGTGTYYSDSIFFLSVAMHRIMPPAAAVAAPRSRRMPFSPGDPESLLSIRVPRLWDLEAASQTPGERLLKAADHSWLQSRDTHHYFPRTEGSSSPLPRALRQGCRLSGAPGPLCVCCITLQAPEAGRAVSARSCCRVLVTELFPWRGFLCGRSGSACWRLPRHNIACNPAATKLRHGLSLARLRAKCRLGSHVSGRHRVPAALQPAQQLPPQCSPGKERCLAFPERLACLLHGKVLQRG
ncbi:Uncharacterized protein C3orf21 [Anas platyrhynchos]|uniref:Uncharacterized protein C3orf21 n=1 Tax=Anas platyrhynchos TaxID=8839 RepID=R0LXH0_ANAPL|nr:Uncharacterized protein C3orf21 [Anas platyrhynchos]